MAYKLTQNDVADLTMLTNFTEELYDTYESLYKLELEGQKDSEEYKNKIERIIDIVNIADNIASRLILTREQFSAVLSYLYQKSGITTSDNTFILISQVNIPKPYLILGRIINRIIDAYFKKRLSESNMTKTENDGNSKEIANLLNFNSTLNIYWLNDIARLQAAILDEMQKQSDSRLKKELIWAKYSLGFLFNELENDYLKNGFRAEEHPFMYHGTAKTIYNIPEKIEKECITRNGRASIALSLECILNLADWPLIDPTKLATVLHQQASIRAILITLDDESANKAIADINVIINGLKGNPHMSIASEILNSIITHRNQDKYIPQILSFSL